MDRIGKGYLLPPEFYVESQFTAGVFCYRWRNCLEKSCILSFLQNLFGQSCHFPVEWASETCQVDELTCKHSFSKIKSIITFMRLLVVGYCYGKKLKNCQKQNMEDVSTV